MSTIPQHSGLDRAATEWVVRLTSGSACAKDIEAAQAWCALSAEHRAAFERARSLWRIAGPPTARAAGYSSPAVRMRRYAAAAVLLLTVGIGVVAFNQHWTADYRTASGEQRTVTLEDGSSVLLDSETALDVRFSAGRRDVSVLSGQALFEVMPNPDRPFVVHAGEVTATAVGTVYAVGQDGDKTDVVVSEGIVSVEKPGTAAVRLHAGERAWRAVESGTVLKESVNVSNALAWQRGVMVFELASLEDVVAALNRHYAGHIVISSKTLRTRKVSGVFQVKRLDEGLRALSDAFGIRVTRITPYLIVLS